MEEKRDRLAVLNRKFKKYESHLDIKLLIDDIEVSTLFKRFSAYSKDGVVFTIQETIGNHKKYDFSYDFNCGVLECINKNGDTKISGLFSKRHLRSLLFFAHEFAFMENEKTDPLTKLLHEKIPVPELWTESNVGYLKHKFKIGHVLVCDDKKIVLDGILSTCDRYNFGFPVFAKCTYTFKNGDYKWEYNCNGKARVIKGREYCTSIANSQIQMPKTILYAQTRIKVLEILEDYSNAKCSHLEREVLCITQTSSFKMISVKKNEMGINVIAEFFIFGLHSINEKDINLFICDGSLPTKVLTYDRVTKKIYLSEPKSNRLMYKEEYVFLPFGNVRKFRKSIKHLLEKADR